MSGRTNPPSFDSRRRHPGTAPTRRGAAGVVALAVVLVAGTLAHFGTALGVTEPTLASRVVAACDGVSLRTAASVSATRKATIAAGATVKVAATVSGGSYSATCAGQSVSGSSWYRITAVGGTSVATLYGVQSVYAAVKLFRTETLATTIAAACSGVNLRTSASTSATIRHKLAAGAKVTAVARVSGSSYSAACAGATVSGSHWFRISKIGSSTVQSLYGVAYLYGASQLFTAVTASPSPTPAPTPTPTPTPSPTPSLAGIFTLGSSVTFHGRGWGHGAGLSQYGTRGRASAGQTSAQILAAYYQGTTLGTVANSQIRVLVLDDFAATATSPVVIVGRGGAWTIDGISGSFPADARARFSPPAAGFTTWRRLVTSSAGATLHDSQGTANVRLRPASDATRLQVDSKPSSYDRYRGVIRVVPSGSRADVVNELPLETYLRGVVPGEMPASWPTEALRTQSVAARSYAARLLRPGISHFDVYDDTRSQVYRGVLAEASTTNSAISATAGKVVKSGSAIANTVYHSTAGGWTEHNENVFVSSTGARIASPASYLRGVSDRASNGTPYDAGSPYATWKTATYTKSQLSTWFASDSRTNVGTLAKLDLRNRGVSGRLVSVTLIGSTGTTKTVSGDVFRAVFNANRPAGDALFRSNLFSLSPIP